MLGAHNQAWLALVTCVALVASCRAPTGAAGSDSRSVPQPTVSAGRPAPPVPSVEPVQSSDIEPTGYRLDLGSAPRGVASADGVSGKLRWKRDFDVAAGKIVLLPGVAKALLAVHIRL